MSLPNLDNFTIEQAEKSDRRFGGCKAKDEVPARLGAKWYCVNLDSSRGEGTHWTLLYNCRPKVVIYFDSYGMPPPEQVEHTMKRTGKEAVYNPVDFQTLGTQQCGWWVRYIAQQLDNGRPLNQVLAQWVREKTDGDGETPDQALEKLFEQYGGKAWRR